MLLTPRLACRLGSCAPVGRVQDRPKRELRPVRGRAPLALAHPPSRAHTMEVYVPSPAREGGVYSIISFQRGELSLPPFENPPLYEAFCDIERPPQ